jgi:fermentation-respiration switch protein FrsA (DUF1100 family)
MYYLLIIVLAFAGFILLLRWREPHMIYYPFREIELTPANLGLRFDDVYLTTADGVKINGWFLPCGQPPRFTVLFLHGNAGNISHRHDKCAVFRELGWDVFIIDYRGYGRSDDVPPNEPGTYRDARAAYDYLTGSQTASAAGTDRRAVRSTVTQGGAPGGRALPPHAIIVYGESLGTAVAVDLATTVPAAGVIIEEPFTSIADVGQKMFPFVPVRLLVRNKYDTLSKIARINAPLLIFHSRDDEIFAFRHAERLLAAAQTPKQLIELRGTHNDACFVSIQSYRDGLRKFGDALSH